MDNSDSIVSRLATRFGNDSTTINEGTEPMLSVKHIYYPNKPFIPPGSSFSGGYNPIILNETLVDHFFKVFNNNLIYNEKNSELILDKIEKFCKENGLTLNVEYDDKKQPNGYINGNMVYVVVKSTTPIREFVYLVLHEISHHITNTASNNKLKRFITDPLSHDVDILNINDIQTELNYFLSPAEISNWALTLSLSMFEEKYKSASEFYKEVKDVVYKVKFENTNIIFSTNFYKNLSEDLRPLYHLVVYVRQLRELKLEHRQRLKYQNKLMSLIKILDKYVKRLNKLFK